MGVEQAIFGPIVGNATSEGWVLLLKIKRLLAGMVFGHERGARKAKSRSLFRQFLGGLEPSPAD
jgi:hypothetical protein